MPSLPPTEGSTPEPPKADDVVERLEANWRALRPIANGDVDSPGVTVEHPHEGAIFLVPPIVRQAVADASPTDGPQLEVVKLAEVVNGTLVRLVDDGTALPDSELVHIVVNVITAGTGAAEARTYEVAAQPSGRSGAEPAPGTSSPEPRPSQGTDDDSAY